MKILLQKKVVISILVMLVCSLFINLTLALSKSTPEPGSDEDPLVSQSYVDASIEALRLEIKKLKDEIALLKSGKVTQTATSSETATTTTAPTATPTPQPKATPTPTPRATPTPTPSITPAPVQTKVEVKTGMVTASALNVRSQPSTTSSILTILYNGTTVTIQETSGSWYRVITTENIEGWVSADYIAMK